MARTCYLESTWSESDCAAIVGVARYRAARTGGDWLDVLQAYSAINKRSSRAAEVRGYTAEGDSSKGVRWQARWQAHMELAAAIVRGERKTPCPSASDWAGDRIASDHAAITRAVQSGRLEIVECARPTANTFLREASPR